MPFLSVPSLAANDGSVCHNQASPADAAVAACTRLLRQAKGAAAATAYFWRGFAHARNSAFDKAIADYSEALRIDPKNASAYNGRGLAYSNDSSHGVLYFDRGQLDRALADFNEAVRLAPKISSVYANRANVHYRMDQLDLAIADYDKALQLDSTSAKVYNNRGMAYQKKGDYDRAIKEFDHALRLDPRYHFAYTNRAKAKGEKGELDSAFADLGRAIGLDPKSANAYFVRGVLWRARADLDRAFADFNEALRLDPKYLDAYAYRGLIHEAHGDIERARADFKTASELPPRYGLSARAKDMARVRLALLSDNAASSSPAGTPARDAGRRVALAIGNGAYGNVSALANPPNDARAVARELRRMGFEVSEGIDLDHAAMKRLIGDFLRGAATARTAVVFYAGHGMQIDGKNYLVPVDGKLAGGTNLAAEMTEVDTILAGLDDQIRTNIVILDACRDNPLAQRLVAEAGTTRSIGVRSGLAAPSGLGAGATLGAGTLIAFATAPGQVALDGDGANSPFSAALVRHIGTPGLEVQQMLTRVRAEVVAATKTRQVPWSNSSLLGEVYLVR